MPVVSPATGEVVGSIGAATAADVDAAVAAARAAFKGWAATPAAERAVVLKAIAAGIRSRKAELAAMETLDGGKPITEAEWDMDDAAGCFEARRQLAGAESWPLA